MTPEHFCFWLQGYCDINGTPPTPDQWASIVVKLKTVTPALNAPPKFLEHTNGWPVPTSPSSKGTGVYGVGDTSATS